jgi:hypothetical protein
VPTHGQDDTSKGASFTGQAFSSDLARPFLRCKRHITQKERIKLHQRSTVTTFSDFVCYEKNQSIAAAIPSAVELALHLLESAGRAKASTPRWGTEHGNTAAGLGGGHDVRLQSQSVTVL